MRVAAIDLGTNTTRLLVADVDDGHVEALVRREEITRLGEAVDRRRILLPTAIARVRNVLVDYRRAAEQMGAERVLAVGTSAVRDAENGEAFLGELEWSYGITTRLLDGRGEAELMVRGVATGRPLDPRTVVVDVGGGSTELVVVGSAGAVETVSVDLGSVRLTERHLHSDPPTPDEMEACKGAIQAGLPTLDVNGAIGVAGTTVTAAAIELGGDERVAGHRLTRPSVEATLERVAGMRLADREHVHGLAVRRAPVIVAGLMVLREILAGYGLDAIEVSVRDLLDGAALAAADLPAPEEGPVPPGAYTCC